ncbi:MAG: DUF1847 domain-containing protein [Tissierellia bacterium]|nr:DUF1847 domain-containing protein [Tissierellia bacterium]
MDPKCSYCSAWACVSDDKSKMPGFCPMEDEAIYKKAYEITASDKYREFYKNSSEIEKDGYRMWPRVKETMELIRRMNYERVGFCFCKGLSKEARILTDIFKRNGIDLITAMCKTGGVDKSKIGIPDSEKIKPGHFEPMCNPVAQALILNKANTQLNIVMGLCVGHDALFYKFSDALCTTIVVKDRVTGNNPCVVLYGADGYFNNRIDLD